MSTENTPGSGREAGTAPLAARQIHEVGTAMLRGGLWPALAVGVVTVVVAGLLAGSSGVPAALLGVVLVLVVCALGPLVMRWTASAEPMVVMGIAMISFVTKIGVLAILFLVLGRLHVVDTRVLALAVGATALAFIAGETVAFARSRVPPLTS